MRHSFLSMVALGAAISAAVAQSPRDDLKTRLDSLLRTTVAESLVAGAAAVVAHGRDTLLHKAYGFAELSFRVPATIETRFRLIGGSVLLAAAVLRAAEQGRLSLDDDAAKFLPTFPWQGRRVTIRQLLNATSALGDYHYLGDATTVGAHLPMRTDQVIALIAGRPLCTSRGRPRAGRSQDSSSLG